MSDEIQGLTVKVGITDQLFQEGITKINSSMKILQSEFKASSESLKGFGSSADQLGNKSKYLSDAIELQKAKVQALYESYEKAKTNTGEFSTQTANAATKVNNASAYLSKMQNELKATDAALEKTNAEEKKINWKESFEKAGSSAETASSKISGIKNAVVGIAATVAGGAGLYEYASSALNAGNNAYMLSSRLGVTAQDASLLSKMLSLTGTSTDSFTSTMTRMDKSVLSAGKSGNTTTKALAEYGVKLTDAKGKMLPMTDQLGVLATAYQKATDAGTEDAFTTQVLGNRGQELIPILQNYTTAKDEAAKTTGMGIDPNEAHKLTLELNQLKLQVGLVGSTIAKALIPVVSTILPPTVKLFQDLGKQIKDNQPQIQAFVQSMINIGSTIVNIVAPPIKDIFNFIAEHGEATKNVVMALGAGFVALKTVQGIVSGITGAMKLWEGATNAMKIAQTTLNAVMDANPIGLIIIAIAALVAGLVIAYNKFGWFRDGVKAIISDIAGFFQGFSTTVGDVFNTIGNIITVAVELIASIFKGAITIITLPFQAIWENCKGIITSAWNVIYSTISSALNTVGSVVLTGFNEIKEVITTIWNAVSSFFGSIFSKIGNTISSGISTAKNVITEGFNAVNSFVSSIWSNIRNTITSAFSAIVSTISNSPVAHAAENIFNGVKNAISGAIDGAKNIVSSGLNTIKNFFAGLILKLPHIDMPHFKLNGKFSLSPPSVPSLGVDWYANGGIFNSPSVIGVGENGKEAVMPLENNTGWIDELANKLSGKMGNDENSLILNIEKFYNNTDKDIEQLAQELQFYTQRQQKSVGNRR